MMTEDGMRLFREQMEAWMKIMNPAVAMQNPTEAQRTWENLFHRQLELWEAASDSTLKQVESLLRPFQQQMEATQAASQEMQRVARWFTDETVATFQAMRDYYSTLADIEEQLAKLHRMASDQVERMQSAMPFRPRETPAG
jgi:phenylalanine-4-hydroxylase